MEDLVDMYNINRLFICLCGITRVANLSHHQIIIKSEGIKYLGGQLVIWTFRCWPDLGWENKQTRT